MAVIQLFGIAVDLTFVSHLTILISIVGGIIKVFLDRRKKTAFSILSIVKSFFNGLFIGLIIGIAIPLYLVIILIFIIWVLGRFLIKYSIKYFIKLLKLLKAIINFIVRTLANIENRIPYIFAFSILLFLSFGTLISLYIDINISNFNISNERALSLLNLMAQILAAILAIIIGFSLINYQLSVQIVGHQILDLYTHDRSFWILLLIYTFSILYDIILIRLIPNSDASIDTLYIDFGIILCSISITSLFPYTYHTIENLKPEKMIQKVNSEENLLPLIYHAISTENQKVLSKGINKLLIHKELKYETFLKSFSIISILEKYSFEKNSEESLVTISKSLESLGIQTINELVKKSREKEEDLSYIEEISSIIDGALFDFCKKTIDKNWRRATKSILESKGSLTAYSNTFSETSNEVFNISNLIEEFLKLKTNEERIFLTDYFIEIIVQIPIKIWSYKYYMYFYSYKKNDMDINIYLEGIRKILANSNKYSKHIFNLIGKKGISFASESKKHKTIFICLCLKEIGVSHCSKNIEHSIESVLGLLRKIYESYREAQADIKPNWKEELIDLSRGLFNKIGLLPDFEFQEIKERIDEKKRELKYDRERDVIDVTESILDIYEELIVSMEKFSKTSLKLLLYSLILIYSNNKDNETIKSQISSIFTRIINKSKDEELLRTSLVELDRRISLDELVREKIPSSFESNLRDFLRFCCKRYVFWL